MSDAIEKDAMRMLAAIYRLSKGQAGALVARADVLAECARARLFELSDEEFMAYRRAAVAEARASRKENCHESS